MSCPCLIVGSRPKHLKGHEGCRTHLAAQHCGAARCPAAALHPWAHAHVLAHPRPDATGSLRCPCTVAGSECRHPAAPESVPQHKLITTSMLAQCKLVQEGIGAHWKKVHCEGHQKGALRLHSTVRTEVRLTGIGSNLASSDLVGTAADENGELQRWRDIQKRCGLPCTESATNAVL